MIKLCVWGLTFARLYYILVWAPLSHMHLSLSLSLLFMYPYIPLTTPLEPFFKKRHNKRLIKRLVKGQNIAMEVAMELEIEDDVFFADISKQINLLITDEDEHNNPISLSSSVSFQGLFRESYQTLPTPYMMYGEQNYYVIRESKGTGVFIPRCSQPRKKHNHHQNQKKQVRFGSFIPKQQFPQHVHNKAQESINLHASTNTRRTYRDAASLFT